MKKIDIDVQKITDLYNAGLSCLTIAKQFNVSEALIKQRLKTNNIKIRNLRDSHLKKKFNEDFFKTIDTEAKAYWLGFFFADGSICNSTTKHGYSSFQCSLSQKEKEPLEKFIKSIDGKNINITEYKIKDKNKNIKGIQYSVCFNSPLMFNSLVNKGCTLRKSLILKFPTEAQIPKHLIHHFIRGYFDGDGSIYFSNNSVKHKTHTAIYSRGCVSICGTLEFLTEMKKTILSIPFKLYKEQRRESNTWNLRVSGSNRTLDFYNYLYKDATIFLDRKKIKFEQIEKERGSTTIIGTPTRTPSFIMKERERNKV